MAQDVCVLVTADDRARLAAIAGDGSRPYKHVLRARIILHSADCLPVQEVARRAGVSRPAVWRWQRRFAELGVDGLLREKPRIPGKPPLPRETVERVLALNCTEPPGEGNPLDRPGDGQGRRHWAQLGAAHLEKARPAGIRTFKRSNDLEFAAKLRDIVGLYMNPPAHAIVLSIDEISQIQALDRTQPGLPLKPGRRGTMTHDYKRHGTTTLFAALNVLDGTVFGRCMQRHRHQGFIRFLNAIEREIPPGKVVRVVLDNYAAHKAPKVIQWLTRHPRWVFHFTPTSGSWLNAVETFFSALTRRRLRRGVFHSIVDLQAVINRYLEDHNDDPKPFVWAKSAETIIPTINRLPVPSQ